MQLTYVTLIPWFSYALACCIDQDLPNNQSRELLVLCAWSKLSAIRTS
ncbi:hypothetical protein KP509_11G083700 [Ceratopteris richardii]|uniref:Uncharacterized protein n=1 Tax=Ceratopteris richardii TaxID=49495 RepID=A0A8T2TUY4_CERRI|nr:hypothetical protein KP509_11G083700 [Ceratopteris richardii]